LFVSLSPGLEIKTNVISVNRKIALVIILTRAGLDLDSEALKRMRITVPKLGLVPWFVECAVIAIMTHYLLGLPWIWAFLLGYAVSNLILNPLFYHQYDYIFKIEYKFFL
jgi:NhaP-type Na+/H+ or K+/H+ antiporter